MSICFEEIKYAPAGIRTRVPAFLPGNACREGEMIGRTTPQPLPV